MCGFPESYVFSYSLSLKRLFILLLQGNLNDPKFNSLDGLDREILFLIHFPDREKPLNKGEKKEKKKKPFQSVAFYWRKVDQHLKVKI